MKRGEEFDSAIAVYGRDVMLRAGAFDIDDFAFTNMGVIIALRSLGISHHGT